MTEYLKKLARKILNFLHIDLTKNLEYDRLTEKIISQNVKINSNCIDIGAHKGEILDLFLKYAPHGNHYAFEPIPQLYNKLEKRYSKNCKVYPIALSDEEGQTKFQFVKNAPAYSGINKRRYDIKNPVIEEIIVLKNTLDEVLYEAENRVDFIKIDVEGGEFPILKGAEKIIKRDKPFIIFECGIGASDYYGTKPEDIYGFITNTLLMNIATLKDWLKNKNYKLSEEQFCSHFEKNTEYYFFAYDPIRLSF